MLLLAHDRIFVTKISNKTKQKKTETDKPRSNFQMAPKRNVKCQKWANSKKKKQQQQQQKTNRNRSRCPFVCVGRISSERTVIVVVSKLFSFFFCFSARSESKFEFSRGDQRKKMRVHRSAAQRRLTALGSVDTQLTPPSLSRLSQQLGAGLARPLRLLFLFFFFAGSTQERATTISQPQQHNHTHTGPVCARIDVEKESEGTKKK